MSAANGKHEGATTRNKRRTQTVSRSPPNVENAGGGVASVRRGRDLSGPGGASRQGRHWQHLFRFLQVGRKKESPTTPPGSSTFLCFQGAGEREANKGTGTLLRLCSLHSDNSFASARLCVICGSRRWWFNSRLFSPVSGGISGFGTSQPLIC